MVDFLENVLPGTICTWPMWFAERCGSLRTEKLAAHKDLVGRYFRGLIKGPLEDFDEIKTAGVGVGLGNVLYGWWMLMAWRTLCMTLPLARAVCKRTDWVEHHGEEGHRGGKTCPFGELYVSKQNLVAHIDRAQLAAGKRLQSTHQEVRCATSADFAFV